MGSALLNTAGDLEFARRAELFASTLRPAAREGAEHEQAAGRTADALRTQVAERLAAHRRRRSGAKAEAEAERPRLDGRSAQIAAAVAERYARTPSYREMLAAEAERAIRQARAAAEVAAQNAQAIAAAQQQLLIAYDEQRSREQAEQSALLPACDSGAENEKAAKTAAMLRSAGGRANAVRNAAGGQPLWPELAEFEERGERAEQTRAAKTRRRASVRQAQDTGESTASRTPATGLTVRLYEDAMHGSLLSARGGAIAVRASGRGERGFTEEVCAAEAMALDEEIAFRQAPVFEEPVGPPVELPANLIEFPRQLVASRKARPRYAEGPLRDEMEARLGDGQLRIFEVDPAQISTSPAEVETRAAQWTSLWLDGPAHSTRTAAETDALDAPVARAIPALEPASLARRAVAGAINLGVVGCGLLAFAAVSAAIGDHGAGWHAGLRQAVRAWPAQTRLPWRMIAAIGAVSGAFLMLLYHGLFFRLSTATPGMRTVRIALCTFEDENPTRAGVRRRMAATLLSACSLGLGYAWAALDDQRLTWHDRMSRMYLRRY
ncbi:MAG TPA: RDD family protein [Acidobacteriaceae bacterium]|nr:RDD family protein [Acidobacteriaceae bacterium]